MHANNYFWRLLPILVSMVLVLGACLKKPEALDEKRLGLKPIYLPENQARIYAWEPPRLPQNLGTFLVLDSFFVLIEDLRGLHFYDNRQPAQPSALAFLSLPGCRQAWFNPPYLYVDNFTDLLVLSIEVGQSLRLIYRFESYFSKDNFTFPPPQGDRIYFECVDFSRGWPVAWELDSLLAPACRRFG